MKQKITTTLKDGSVIEYDVILTFKNDKNNKNYIVYTDNKIDKDNKLKIYAAIYNPLNNEFISVPKKQSNLFLFLFLTVSKK